MAPRRLAALSTLLAVCLASNGLPARAVADAQPPLVFAAASLTDVLRQVAADYAPDRPQAVRFSFASTATLARQIEVGAPADLIFAADADWMEYLATRQRLRIGSRVDLLGNALVLIAPARAPRVTTTLSAASLRAALGATGRFALADPASVPAGKYAKAAMRRLGVWEAVQSRIVSADNVRTALQFVARGDAPLGVVYETDARAEPRVRVVARFPDGSHPPIFYSLALTQRATPAAEDFFRYLTGPAARQRFEAAGFRLLGGVAPASEPP